MGRARGIISTVALGTVALGVLFAPSGADAAVPLLRSVKPDAVLAAGDTFVKVARNLNVSDDVNAYSPSACRNGLSALRCDVYRIKLKRNMAPDALNFVFFSVDFDPLFKTPEMPAISVGVPGIPVGDLDVQVFDRDDHYLGQNYPTASEADLVVSLIVGLPVRPLSPVLGRLAPVLSPEPTGDRNDRPPGGATYDAPERGGFIAKQDVYDVEIVPILGFNTSYTLRVGFTDGNFAQPSEVVDPEVSAPGFGSDPVETPSDSSALDASTAPLLTSADVRPDADLAGIGFGIDEHFDAPPAFAFRGARHISNMAAPSWMALVGGLLVAPGAVAIGATLLLRRRRNVLF